MGPCYGLVSISVSGTLHLFHDLLHSRLRFGRDSRGIFSSFTSRKKSVLVRLLREVDFFLTFLRILFLFFLCLVFLV